MNTAPYDAPAASDKGEISLVEIASTMLRNWRLIVVLPVLLALAAGVWSFARDRTYAASASFVPQAAEGRSAGAAAALAQQFGVNLGTERPGQSPQFYVDLLLRSSTLLRQAVEAEYHLPGGQGQEWTGTLVQYWKFDAAGGRLPPWRLATEKLSEALSVSVSQVTGVVQLSVEADHPLLAERIAERLLQLLNAFNLEVRQSRAQEEGRFIGEALAEAQTELLTAEGLLQEFLRQNRQFVNSPELMFEHDRLQREVVMRQEVYTSLLRSQEQAKIDAVRDTPLFTVIDHPAGTAEPQGRGILMRALLAFVLGLIVAVFIAFVTEFARRSRQQDDPRYREFQGLARQAWSDARRPGKWLRRGDPAAPARDA
jgi:uncharacterized protein involved in exopolysaccharide biosynthesis